MYHDKQKLATALYEILDDLILEGEVVPVSIDKLLTPKQKYDLIMTIVNKLPNSHLRATLNLFDDLEVEKESTFVVEQFKYAKGGYERLLEYVFSIGVALNISPEELYKLYTTYFNRVRNKGIIVSLASIYKYLINTLISIYALFRTFNLIPIIDEGIDSTLTTATYLRIPNTKEGNKLLKASIHYYTEIKNREVISKYIKNKTYIVIRDKHTGVLLPSIEHPANELEIIVYNYLKNQ